VDIVRLLLEMEGVKLSICTVSRLVNLLFSQLGSVSAVIQWPLSAQLTHVAATGFTSTQNFEDRISFLIIGQPMLRLQTFNAI